MTYTKTVALPVSPDEAFTLITEPERLRRWMGVTARVDLRAGGAYRWTVTPGHIAAGTFREIDPGKRIVFGLGWEGNPDLASDASIVTITVEPDGAGSRVTLIHEGLTADQEVGHAEGWDHFLDRLQKVAAVGDAGPDEWAAAPENLDQLSAAEASLAVLQGVLRQLTTADRTKQTPCDDYDCHALAEHLFGSLSGLGSMIGAEVKNPEEGSLENRISTMAATALEAWRARGLDGMVPGPGGDMPATVGASIFSIEFLVHAWDFAQASDATVTASDELIAYVQGLADQIIPTVRGTAFADEVAPSPDAGALDRLAAFAGRSPLAAV